jgi:RNA polymerase sigma-70 factor (ECF subfamily)
MDDRILMERVREGDEEAFRQIVEKYREPVFRLSFRYVANQQDAEEVTQDVFIRLYRSAPTYTPDAKLFTYLYRITVNLSLNKIRDRKWKRYISWEALKNQPGKHPIEDKRGNPEDQMENQERQRLIREAIDALPASQRTAVILKRYNDLSYEEIAQILDCSVSAVEARLHRAKLNLQKKLKPLLSI